MGLRKQNTTLYNSDDDDDILFNDLQNIIQPKETKPRARKVNATTSYEPPIKQKKITTSYEPPIKLKKANPWIDYAKVYAEQNGISYALAVNDKNAQDGYKKYKQRMANKNK